MSTVQELEQEKRLSEENTPKEEDELEEGEIADDSNDGCSDIAVETTALSSNAGPQKKKKKVVRKVRKVRKKIKVKKKVVKKKVDSLWEQQILMYEELQKQQSDQILRAAAFDEDLRIFPMMEQPAQQAPHQTPSSPDDETSYEAISKMLTLLRNSVNVSSETPEDTTESPEYTLVPILVEGIDYTRYKLLSQYEPKFKNDPRLNQQT